ncbi:MAG: sulfotransferase [Chloroflexi bacterium]|nr:sulfotransferase [Chloroflexota bacterium]
MGFLKKLFQPQTKKPIIIVSGLPRSGTSMMMKMLEAGGIPPLTDKLREADSDNPKGYYEFERVKQMDKGDVKWLEDTQGKAVKVISALLKYLPNQYEYRIVFMRRNMPEILASQRKMLINRGENPDDIDDAQMAELFDKHLHNTLQWIDSQPNVSALYIHYSDMLVDPMPLVEKINHFLDQDMDTIAMAGIVDPDLYRNRAAQ